jgi:prepilin signal peptidase PulO-like enzyme (type II secretory pathway)
MESLLEASLAAAVGLTLGHLVDLYWGRFYSGEPIAGPPTRCANCRSPTALSLLLPFTAGVRWAESGCPNCGEAVNPRSIYLPVGASLLFLLAYQAYDGALGGAILGGFFATLFFTLALTDLEERLLPNRIVYPGIILAVLFCWGWPETSVLQILGGGVAGLLIAVLLLIISLPFGSDALGMGDLKMVVLMGFVLGVPSVFVGVVLGTLAAGAVAALLLITGRAGRRDYIPHGPFLALGAIVALFWGHDLWPY